MLSSSLPASSYLLLFLRVPAAWLCPSFLCRLQLSERILDLNSWHSSATAADFSRPPTRPAPLQHLQTLIYITSAAPPAASPAVASPAAAAVDGSACRNHLEIIFKVLLCSLLLLLLRLPFPLHLSKFFGKEIYRELRRLLLAR